VIFVQYDKNMEMQTKHMSMWFDQKYRADITSACSI